MDVKLIVGFFKYNKYKILIIVINCVQKLIASTNTWQGGCTDNPTLNWIYVKCHYNLLTHSVFTTQSGTSPSQQPPHTYTLGVHRNKGIQGYVGQHAHTSSSSSSSRNMRRLRRRPCRCCTLTLHKLPMSGFALQCMEIVLDAFFARDDQLLFVLGINIFIILVW